VAAVDDAAEGTNRLPKTPIIGGLLRGRRDLRDAAISTREAVCYMTIPSVDTARLSWESPEEI
jgi:hypothetical protein